MDVQEELSIINELDNYVLQNRDQWTAVQPDQVRKAALSFRVRTCQPGSSHPRHIGILRGAEAHKATASLYNIIEHTGVFPRAERAMCTLLYQKVAKYGQSKKGVRPIANCRGLLPCVWGWGACEAAPIDHMGGWFI